MLYMWINWTCHSKCPQNKPIAQRNENIAKACEESNEEGEMNNPPEEGESIMMKRVLVKIENKVHEPAQRKSLCRAN